MWESQFRLPQSQSSCAQLGDILTQGSLTISAWKGLVKFVQITAARSDEAFVRSQSQSQSSDLSLSPTRVSLQRTSNVSELGRQVEHGDQYGRARIHDAPQGMPFAAATPRPAGSDPRALAPSLSHAGGDPKCAFTIIMSGCRSEKQVCTRSTLRTIKWGGDPTQKRGLLRHN